MVRRILAILLLMLLAAPVAQAASFLKGDSPVVFADANGKGYNAGDSLATQASDTSSVFSIKNLTHISAWVQANCDSTTIAIQTSMDGTVWRTFYAATYAGGTKGSITGIFHKYLNLTGSTGTDYGSVHLGNSLRFILKNNDASAVNNGATSRTGAKSITYYIQGTVL